MNNAWKWLFIGVVIGVVVVARADSPVQWRGNPGWEPEGAYCRLYDAKTVVTLKGTVQRVEKIIPMKGMGSGVHLILKTDTETIPVQMGPVSYVEKQPVQIQTGDVVDVTGSRVSCDGKPVIMAASIKRGSDTVKFRELKGTPAWITVTH